MTKRRNEPALSNFLKNGLGGSQLKASDRDARRLRRPSRFDTMSDAIPKFKVCTRPSVIPLVPNLVPNYLFPITCFQPCASLSVLIALPPCLPAANHLSIRDPMIQRI